VVERQIQRSAVSFQKSVGASMTSSVESIHANHEVIISVIVNELHGLSHPHIDCIGKEPVFAWNYDLSRRGPSLLSVCKGR
jgi:hypothetical protein